MENDIDIQDTTYKYCDCDIEGWEVAVVRHSEKYNDRDVGYHYCIDCDTDWVIEDLHTGEILYRDSRVELTR